jgi:hypothetical protein
VELETLHAVRICHRGRGGLVFDIPKSLCRALSAQVFLQLALLGEAKSTPRFLGVFARPRSFAKKPFAIFGLRNWGLISPTSAAATAYGEDFSPIEPSFGA